MKRILLAFFVSAALAASVPMLSQGAKPGGGGEGETKPSNNGGNKPEQGPKPSGPSKPEEKPKPSGPSKPEPKPKPSGPSRPEQGPKPSGPSKPEQGPRPSEQGNGGSKPRPSQPSNPGGEWQKPQQSQGNGKNPDDIRNGRPVQLQPDYNLRKNRGQSGPVFDPRSGGGNYDSNSNLNNRSNRGQIQNQDLRNLPQPSNGRGTFERGSLAFQIQRMEDYRNGELRRGYYHYDPFWSDCHFGFFAYIFDPYYSRNAWFSPYYWYPSVPGYLNAIVIRLGHGLTITFLNNNVRWNYCGYDRGYGYGNYGNYDPYDRYDRYGRNYALDESLSMLTDAFRYGDTNLLGELVLNRSTISIYIDGQYSYDLRGEDYFDMTADLLESVRTTDFRIDSVRPTENYRYMRVNARHEYLDPWNRRQTVYLTFTLKNSGDHYQIVEAGTSRDPYNYR